MSTNTRRRKNAVGTCENCTKPFSHYSYQPQRYCSQKCRGEGMRRANEGKCAVCSKSLQVTGQRKTRNKNHYCSRVCYELRRKEGLKKVKRHTAYFRALVFNSKCSCGENKEYLLQVHHIDGNTNNNDPTNHEIVCGNCHIKRHLKLNKQGRWVHHPRSLTDRSLLNVL